MTCKPYDKTTNSGGYCFGSLICKVLGVKYDDACVRCFTASGIVVDNDARPDKRDLRSERS